MAECVLDTLPDAISSTERERIEAFLGLGQNCHQVFFRVYHSSAAQGVNRLVPRGNHIDLIPTVLELMNFGAFVTVDLDDELSGSREEVLRLLSTSELNTLCSICGIHFKRSEMSREKSIQALSGPLRRRQSTLGCQSGQVVQRAVSVGDGLRKVLARNPAPLFRQDLSFANLVHRLFSIFFSA